MIALWMLPLGLAAGAAIGFLGGMLGIGGGLIAIPVLGLLLGMDQQLAQGTAVILVLPTIVMSVRKYHQQSPIDLKIAFFGALSTVISTWFGARLALGLDPLMLRKSFAIFLFALACFYVWQTYSKLTVRNRLGFGLGRNAVMILGLLTGLFGGFFGVGGAILAVPVMTALFGMKQTQAQALSLAMVIPGACVALMTYSLAGQADWTVGSMLAVGSLFCVPLGVRLAHQLPERRLRLAFAAMLFVTVPLLLYQR